MYISRLAGSPCVLTVRIQWRYFSCPLSGLGFLLSRKSTFFLQVLLIWYNHAKLQSVVIRRQLIITLSLRAYCNYGTRNTSTKFLCQCPCLASMSTSLSKPLEQHRRGWSVLDPVTAIDQLKVMEILASPPALSALSFLVLTVNVYGVNLTVLNTTSYL
jgi:hypothetical protein